MTTRRLLSSSSYMAAQGILERVAGLVSTLILARLLLPEDFGLIAMAMMAITFFTTIANTGEQNYLHSREIIDKHDINSAFTLNLLLKIPAYFAILLLSPWIAQAFEEPDVINVLVVLCFLDAFSIFKNPSLVILTREYKYQKIFYLGIVTKIAGIVSTITAAILLKSHWALVIGHGTSTVTNVVGSYLLYKYLPKIDTSRIRVQWSFSVWIILQKIIAHTRNQIDLFITGSHLGKSELGAYNNLKFISQLPIVSFLHPLTLPLINTYREWSNDVGQLKLRVDVSFFIAFVLITPFILVLYNYSFEVVLLLLGSNWVSYHELLAVFSLVLFIRAIQTPLTNLVYIFNDVKILVCADVLILVTIVASLTFLTDLTFMAIAWVSVLAEYLIFCCLFLYLYNRYLGSPSRIIFATTLPVLISIIIQSIDIQRINTEHEIINLAADVSVIISMYFLLLLTGLWLFRKSNIIRYMLETGKEVIKRS